MRVYAHLPMPCVPPSTCHLPMQKKLSCSLPTPTYNVAHAHEQRCPRPWTTSPMAVGNEQGQFMEWRQGIWNMIRRYV